MNARLLPIALLSVAFVPATAQQPTAPLSAAETPAAPVPTRAIVRVRLLTSEGPIVFALEKQRAPITTANFLAYVDGKRLDGATFYRAAKVAPGYGLVQGGVRFDPKRVLPPIAHEPTTKTGLTHDHGAISMARLAPGTATGDFFIAVGAMPSMDADPKLPGDNLGYAVFGHVTEGMDIVRHLLDAPTSPSEGEGVMRGQMLAPPLRIISAKRAE